MIIAIRDSTDTLHYIAGSPDVAHDLWTQARFTGIQHPRLQSEQVGAGWASRLYEDRGNNAFLAAFTTTRAYDSIAAAQAAALLLPSGHAWAGTLVVYVTAGGTTTEYNGANAVVQHDGTIIHGLAVEHTYTVKSAPLAAADRLTTEGGDILTTEGGDVLTTED